MRKDEIRKRIDDLIQELDSCWAERGSEIEGYGKKKYRFGLSFKGRALGVVIQDLKNEVKKLPIENECK